MCLAAACPGLVALVEGSDFLTVHGREERWKEFFDMAKSIRCQSDASTAAPYYLRVTEFFPRLTFAALAPYEHTFHARLRGEAHKAAALTADMLSRYKDGRLELSNGADVRHLSLDISRDDLTLCVNRERALYYKERFWTQWEQKAGDRHKLEPPKSHTWLWQRCDTLEDIQ